jgi:hypothetical protein
LSEGVNERVNGRNEGMNEETELVKEGYVIYQSGRERE